MLDEAGFTDAKITASSDLDEYLIMSLKLQGSENKQLGRGHKADNLGRLSFLRRVYKLAAESDGKGGFIPKIKLSNNPSKVTNPGVKKVLRFYDKSTGKVKADLICLDDEKYSEDQKIKLFDHMAKWKKMVLKPGEYTIKELPCSHIQKRRMCL